MRSFGKLVSVKTRGQEIELGFQNETAYITIMKGDMVRILVPFADKNCTSKAIEGEKVTEAPYSLRESENGLTITTEALRIEVSHDFYVDFYDKNGKLLVADYREERTIEELASWKTLMMLEAEGHDTSSLKQKEYTFEIIKQLDPEDSFYGLGDKSGFLNKRAYEYENWNSDLPQAHNEDFKALYKSVPILMCLKQEAAYGIFFDNTFRSRINIGKENPKYYFYNADAGNLDYYFMAGKDLKDIVASYTYLTGTTPLPQLWTLGYQQSRWGYENAADIRYVVDNYRERQIPLDVVHFDIDYMDNYKVFTWDEKEYEKEGALFAELKAKGVKPVTIIDPGTKKEEGYYVYEEGIKNGYFVKDTDGSVYENAVWPGTSTFPDFGRKEVREWWADKHQYLTRMGVAGVWNDMNEPASFNGPLPEAVVFSDEERKTTHAEMHNTYGHFMSKSTFEGLKKHTGKRPFVITRACYAGTQKYSTVWTGDNQSLWHHLQMVIPQLCNLGLSGFAFCGTDIGGFGADTTPELMCRWIEAACFSPLFRNHSAKGSRKQEPWRFGREVEDINRKYIELRYRFLPYLYDLFYEGQTTGLPIMRPLVLEFPNDREVRNLNSEFMVGDKLLVAPVLEQGATRRMIYLPEGSWYDFWTKEAVTGGQYILREAPIDVCPIYVKAGSIIPTYEPMQYVGEKPYHKLILLVSPGAGEYIHYQDNGEDYAYEEGEYNLYRFTTDAEGELEIQMVHEGYEVYEVIEVKKL